MSSSNKLAEDNVYLKTLWLLKHVRTATNVAGSYSISVNEACVFMCVRACVCVCVCVCKLTSLRWHQPQTPQRATSQTAHTVTARETRNTLRDTEPVHTTRTHMHREAERQKMWVMFFFFFFFCIHGDKNMGFLRQSRLYVTVNHVIKRGANPQNKCRALSIHV